MKQYEMNKGFYLTEEEYKALIDHLEDYRAGFRHMGTDRGYYQAVAYAEFLKILRDFKGLKKSVNNGVSLKEYLQNIAWNKSE